MGLVQEEGRVASEPNKRTRVTGFDSSDLEFIYSTRILLESFAVALTIPTLTAGDIQIAEKALGRMRTAIVREDFAEWRRPHQDFHLKRVQGAGDQFVQLIEVQADRAEPYLRFYQLRDTNLWLSRDTEAEHRDVL